MIEVTETLVFVVRFSQASPQHLVSRLTSRNMHLLALRISSFLDLKPDVVLRHWASAKILQSKRLRDEGVVEDDDREVCDMIVEKFEGLSKDAGEGVSYSEVAKKAWLAGRTKLATMVCIVLYSSVWGLLEPVSG